MSKTRFCAICWKISKALVAIVVAVVALVAFVPSAFAVGGNPFYVCATNAIGKAAEAGRCRWSMLCVSELWDDDVLQDELDAELSKRVPDAYAAAKSCAGNMHNPKLNAIQSDFCLALRNAPTVKRIAAYAEECGFSPDVQVAVEKFEFPVRPDGRRCFRGGVVCRSFVTNGVVVLREMMDVFRRPTRGINDWELGSWSVPDGTCYFSHFSTETDANGTGREVYFFRHAGGVPECSRGPQKVRVFHAPQPFEALDRSKLFSLLSKRMCEISFEEILKTLGQPEAFVEETHPCCGRADRIWRYVYCDASGDRRAIRHELRFYLTKSGVVSRWEWKSSAFAWPKINVL